MYSGSFNCAKNCLLVNLALSRVVGAGNKQAVR